MKHEVVALERLMDKAEYMKRAVEITDLSLRDVVNNKAIAYRRLRDCMGREQLDMRGQVSPEEVHCFLKKHRKIAGKINDTDGNQFRIYSADNPSETERILEDSPDVLEEYIVQHPKFSEIYSKSVNTLRIHTIRNSREVRLVFRPLLSIGAAGSLTDHPICDKALRILLDENGTIIAGIDRWKCYEKMDSHPDTGYQVIPGTTLPFIREACELCLKSALRFPELRYLGWDVAITEKGPVIVEVNSISGLAPKYCSAEDLTEMFRFVSEGAEFSCDPLFRAERFVPETMEKPDRRQMYLICLQAALHRHGIEFSEWTDFRGRVEREIRCHFLFDEAGSTLSAEMNGVRISFQLALPSGEAEEGDLFRIEAQASERADEIYREMRVCVS